MRGIGRFVIAIVQASIIGAMIALPLAASQAPLFNPTSGTLSGLSMVQNQNNANDALATCNAGGSAPSTQFLSGSASNSDCWDDTSTAGWIKRRIWMNGTFVATAFYDLTYSLYTGIVGGGAINSVASAATTDLCAVNPAYLGISGTTAITSFGSTCQTGVWKRIQFAGALTLTYNATTLILPTGANIVTAAGDTADAVALGSGNWIVSNYQRATGAALSSVGLNVGSNALAASALASYQQPVNLQLNTSVASNQLTVAVKGVNGADPSATNPVLVGFRSQTTQPNGTNIFGSLQAAMSFTLSSTSSLGCVTATACRLWVELICQTESAGQCTSILVGLSVQSSASANACYPLLENVLQNTGAGTGGGTSIATIQTSVASLSGKAIRIVGYIEATWTSGTGWSTPSFVQLFGPGVHKPCDVVQRAAMSTTSSSSSGASLVSSNITLSITPTSAINAIVINAAAACQPTGSTIFTGQLRRGPSTVLGAPEEAGTTGTGTVGASVSWPGLWDNPATTSPTTYAIYFNDGTVTGGNEQIEEIMGALDPANDDGAPLRMVG